MTFCRHVFGVEQLAGIADSRRCHGSTCELRTGDIQQASPLQVPELRKLHQILDFGSDLWDRCFAGTVLLTVYARARWSDINQTIIQDCDERGILAYLECRAGVRKTQRARQFKGQLLPLCAPAIGVVESNWAVQFMRARAELGMGSPPDFPLFGAPDANGVPTARHLDTDEAGRWLRCLLFGRPDAIKDRRVTSHSMKATCLSFAAKYGVGISDRLLLGYHTSGDARVALLYSRDSNAHPLRILESALKDIRLDNFRPDSTRFVAKPAVRAEAIEIKDEEDPPEDNSWSGPDRGEPQAEDHADGGHVTAGSSESASSAEEEGSFRRILSPPVLPEGLVNWRRAKSGVHHIARAEHKSLFLCGRKIGPFHALVRDQLSHGAERRRLCHKLLNN